MTTRRILALLPLFLLAAGCAREQRSTAETAVRVRTMTVTASDRIATRSFVGVIEEESSAALSFPVMGTLQGIDVREGDRVGQGTVLAVVDDRSARSSFDAAAAALHQAEDAHARMKRLHDEESLPEVQFVEIETKLSQAQAIYDVARKNLDDCTLRAPFNGVIGRKMADAGANVLPIQPVLTLLKTDRVKVRIAVPEDEIARIGDATLSEVRVPALGERTYTGGRPEKSAVANPSVHTYDVRIPLVNKGGELLPGMVCRVRLSDGKAPAHIVVPTRAVQQASDGTYYVWLADGDRARMQRVVTGEVAGNGIEIREGLDSGSRIVVEGGHKIGQGSKIAW